LQNPHGLAFDASGNLYAACSLTGTILKLDPQGNQTIVASGGNLLFPTGLALARQPTPAQVIQNIQSLQNVVANLAPGAFKNANMQNALENMLNVAIASIDSGNYSTALAQLQSVLGKTNG
jgi:hypothetical protein